MIQDIELNKESQVGLCEQYLLKEMHEPIKSESLVSWWLIIAQDLQDLLIKEEYLF